MMLANDLNFGKRQRMIIKKCFFYDVLLRPLSFPSNLEYSMILQVTLLSCNIVSFVRNTCPSTSSRNKKLIKCFCKTATLLKADITQKEPTTSV